jgi:hypothetical protein
MNNNKENEIKIINNTKQDGAERATNNQIYILLNKSQKKNITTTES